MTQPQPQPDYDPIFNGLINYFKEMAWQRIEDDISIHEIIEILTDFAKMEKEESATHTPAAPATEYTIEQIAEIDNRIRKERKAEREQVLDALEEFLNSDDHLSLFKWEVREQIRSLRGGD